MMSLDDMHLEDISGVKVVTTLIACCGDILDYVRNIFDMNDRLRFEEYVHSICSKLQLSNVLMLKVKNLVQYLSLEILNFFFFIARKVSYRTKFLKLCLSNLCWNTKGIIDRRKTVEILIREESLGLSDRYKLACVYCLEDDILNIWNQLSVNERSSFLTIPEPTNPIIHVVTIWSLRNGRQENILATNASKLMVQSTYSYSLICSVHEPNVEAFIHFWKNVPRRERRHVIYYSISMLELAKNSPSLTNPHEPLYDTVFAPLGDITAFIIFEIADEELEIFLGELNGYAVLVFERFLVWRYRDHFLSVFEKFQPLITSEEYVAIIKLLETNILRFSKFGDRFYLNLLGNVWRKSSETNKESIYSYLPSLLSTVLYFRGTQLTFLILNDLPEELKANVLFNNLGKDVCKQLARDKKWNVLELLVDMCVPKEKLSAFRSFFVNPTQQGPSPSSSEPLTEMDDCASQVYNFLADRVKKRNFDDTEINSVKKVCRE